MLGAEEYRCWLVSWKPSVGSGHKWSNTGQQWLTHSGLLDVQTTAAMMGKLCESSLCSSCHLLNSGNQPLPALLWEMVFDFKTEILKQFYLTRGWVIVDHFILLRKCHFPIYWMLYYIHFKLRVVFMCICNEFSARCNDQSTLYGSIKITRSGFKYDLDLKKCTYFEKLLNTPALKVFDA